MLKDGVALGRPKRILRQATVGFVHGSADLNPFNAAPLGSYAEGSEWWQSPPARRAR
jgi:hypothetical protein